MRKPFLNTNKNIKICKLLVVPLAVDALMSDEACGVLMEELMAFGTSETLAVEVEVGSDLENKLFHDILVTGTTAVKVLLRWVVVSHLLRLLWQ